MAWAALIPVALQLLKGGEEKPAPAMPAPPTIGDMFKDNMQPATPHTFAPSQTIQAGPVGGNRGY